MAAITSSSLRWISACMFWFGLVSSLPRALLWMAAEDIVSGTVIQSSLAAMLFSCGDLLPRLLITPIFKRIPTYLLMVVFGILWVTAYVLLVAVDQVQLRLAGTFFMGTEIGLLEVIIMFLIARFNKVEESSLSAFLVGISAIILIFALYYTGFTIWLCLPPRLVVAVIYPFNLLVFIFYWILDHGPLKKYQIQYQEIQYKEVSQREDNDSKPNQSYPNGRLQFLVDVFPFFGYYFVTHVSFYLAIISVLTTIVFPSSPFRTRDHYNYYRISGDIGMILGGSEIMFVSCLCPGLLKFIRVRRLWIPILLNISHLMFFLLEAWYHFLPNVYVLLLLCCTHSFVFGSTTVNVLANAADKFPNTHVKGVALNITEFGAVVARLTSGLLGLFVEQYLREHCTNNLLMGKYCLARFDKIVGWKENLDCSR